MLNQLEQAFELRLHLNSHLLIRSSSAEQIQIAKTFEEWNCQRSFLFWFDLSLQKLDFSLRLIVFLIVQYLNLERAKSINIDWFLSCLLESSMRVNVFKKKTIRRFKKTLLNDINTRQIEKRFESINTSKKNNYLID
jgi:hypothetical protein